MVIHQLFPGCVMPHMIPGDICIIDTKEYIYRGEVESMREVPINMFGVYFIKSTGKYYLRHMKNDNISKLYSQQHLRDTLNDKGPITRVRQQFEQFKVDIEPSDNYLKVILKKIINSMNIDIRDYKSIFGSDNHMNNMRRLLIKPANLTYEKFQEWLDILGYSHEIKIYDKDGKEFDIT